MAAQEALAFYEPTPFPDTYPSNIPLAGGVHSMGFTAGPVILSLSYYSDANMTLNTGRRIAHVASLVVPHIFLRLCRQQLPTKWRPEEGERVLWHCV